MDPKEMRRKRAELWKQAREILDKAQAENRDLTGEETQGYEERMAEIDRLKGEIDREERMADIGRELETPGREPMTSDPEGEDRTEVRATATPEYRSAFDSYMRRQSMGLITPDEFRALNEATGSEGGYLVPEEYETTIVEMLSNENIMRSLATVITTTSDRKIPVETSEGTASWIAEAGSFVESDVALAQKELDAHKVGTIIKVSVELLQDSMTDLESYIGRKFAKRVGACEEEAFVNGDGVGKPKGIIRDAGTGVTAASASAITSDELIDFYHSLGQVYRRRGTFIMNDSTAKVIRKLKNSVSGDYHWQPGLQAGQPDVLLSRPVMTSDYMPAIAASAKVICFADCSYYEVADRAGRVMQRLNELYAANGQVGFLAYQRVDGLLILASAAKNLVMHA